MFIQGVFLSFRLEEPIENLIDECVTFTGVQNELGLVYSSAKYPAPPLIQIIQVPDCWESCWLIILVINYETWTSPRSFHKPYTEWFIVMHTTLGSKFGRYYNLVLRSALYVAAKMVKRDCIFMF